MKRLSIQQQKFADNWLKRPKTGWSTAKCYMDAYPRVKREETARVNATRLLTKANVAAYIEKSQERIQKRTELTAERILQEEKCLCLMNPKDLMDLEKGTLLKPHELPESVARAISSIEQITDVAGNVKFKYRFWDKGQALARVEKILGVSGPKGTEDDPICHKMTNYPPEAETLAEWEAQVKAAREAMKKE